MTTAETAASHAPASPYALAGATILIWSFGTYLGRLLSMQSEFLLVLFMFLCAAAVLGVYFGWQWRRSGGRMRFEFHWTDLFWGPLGYFAYTVPQVQSFRAFGSASETTILTYTWPIFAALFARWLARRQTGPARPTLAGWLEGLALLLGLVSAALVATQGQLAGLRVGNPAGLFWGLVTGVSYGLFSAYSAGLPQERQPAFLLSATLASAGLLVPFAAGEWGRPGLLTPANLGIAAIMGGLGSGVGYICWTTALRRAVEQGASLARLLALVYLLPLLSLLVVAVLLGEGSLTRPYFLGAVGLILASSVLSQRAGAIAGWIERPKKGTTDEH